MTYTATPDTVYLMAVDDFRTVAAKLGVDADMAEDRAVQLYKATRLDIPIVLLSVLAEIATEVE